MKRDQVAGEADLMPALDRFQTSEVSKVRFTGNAQSSF